MTAAPAHALRLGACLMLLLLSGVAGRPARAQQAVAQQSVPAYQDRFIVGDYVFSPTVYNELSAGNHFMGASGTFRAGLEFSAGGLPLMVEVDGRQYQYQHAGTLESREHNGAGLDRSRSKLNINGHS